MKLKVSAAAKVGKIEGGVFPSYTAVFYAFFKRFRFSRSNFLFRLRDSADPTQRILLMDAGWKLKRN